MSFFLCTRVPLKDILVFCFIISPFSIFIRVIDFRGMKWYMNINEGLAAWMGDNFYTNRL